MQDAAQRHRCARLSSGFWSILLLPAGGKDDRGPSMGADPERLEHKFSSVHERRVFHDLLNPERADDADDQSNAQPEALEGEDVETEDWSWEAEDDFTLGQLFMCGVALDQSIIYVSRTPPVLLSS